MAVTFPNALDGLQLWLRAKSLIQNHADSAAVASWPDLSGNGNHATQATAGNRPLFRTNILNGLPVVRFDGSNDHLIIPHAAGLDFGTGGATLFAVFIRETSATTNLRLLSKGANADSQAGYSIFGSNTGSTILIGNGISRLSSSISHGGVGAGSVMTSLIDRASTIQAYDRGVLENANSLASFSGSLSSGLDLYIGSSTVPGLYWIGDIAELVIFNRALSTAERQTVESYLMAEYGFTAHPGYPDEEIDAIDDAIGEQVMCDAAIGGERAEEWDGADHWLFLDGVMSEGVKLGQLSGQRDIGSRGTLRVTLLKTPDVPLTAPPIGTTVQLSWRDHLQWAGLIENVRSKNVAGTYDTVLEVSLDCASWERLAERRLITQSYTDQTTRAIFLDVISTILAAEGITAGVIDTGLTLSFAGPQQEGQYIRCHEFLRDVAEASGGVHEIDPWKRLNFRKQTTNAGAVQLTNLTALQEVESAQERQDYRNVQIVKVRGTPQGSPPVGTELTSTVTREDDDEIAARQAIEGGSGRYEAFDEITHPFSNDVVECERLGIAAAIVKLNTFGRHQRSLRAQINEPSYRLGDIVTVRFSEHQVAGTWQLAGVRFRSVQDTLRMELDLIQTSLLQRAFQAWLKITDAGRALVQIPGTPIFTNEVTITANGTWVVPDANGDGTPVEVQVACYGAGAGGQANTDNNGSNHIIWDAGAPGGNGGKATSFRTYAVGTVLTIIIGAEGTGGVYAAPLGHQRGTDGGLTKVEVSGAVVAQGDGGSASGAHGGATGDFPFTGEGSAGGAGGAGGVLIGGQDGQPGTAGRVVITY